MCYVKQSRLHICNLDSLFLHFYVLPTTENVKIIIVEMFANYVTSQ